MRCNHFAKSKQTVHACLTFFTNPNISQSELDAHSGGGSAMTRPSKVISDQTSAMTAAELNPETPLDQWISQARYRRCIGPVVILVSLGFALWWSWGTWPDVLVDFGRELYTPWQITQGKVLYRDITSFYGPLSPYVNALWFRCFGVSLQTLVWCNVALFGAMLGLIYSIVMSLAGRIAATMAGVATVLIFGCAQYVGIGNYNYVCPYSHEATHGLLLSLLAIFALIRFARVNSLKWVWLGGACVGLTFLTKPEIFIACAPPVLMGLLSTCWIKSTIRPHVALAVFVIAAAAGPVVAFALLSTAMPPGEAWRGVLGSWAFLGNDRLTSLPFYQRGMGIDHVAFNIGAMALNGLWYAIVLAAQLAIALTIGRKHANSGLMALAGFLVAAVGFTLMWQLQSYGNWVRSLPIWMAAAVGVNALSAARTSQRTHMRVHAVMLASTCCFGLLMLIKIVLFARFIHYGFVLSMPAMIVATGAIGGALPRWVNRKGGSGLLVQVGGLTACAILCYLCLLFQSRIFSAKSLLIGQGGDEFRTTAIPGSPIQRCMQGIQKLPGGRKSMVVLPEGVMLNYLLRIPNPTPFLTFLPPDVIMFTEERLLKALKAHPPDLIVGMPRDTTEYGLAQFGRDYNQALNLWVINEYDPMFRISDSLPGAGAFSITVFQRKDLHGHAISDK
jgi:hypothetical protein